MPTGKDIPLGKLQLDYQEMIKAAKAVDGVGASLGNLGKTTAAIDKAHVSTSRLTDKLGKLSSFGRDLRQAGGFLGSSTLTAIGDVADGFGDISQSIDAIVKQKGGLSSVLKLGAAGIGGAIAGAGIYDATIGKMQGTDTATILKQIGELFRVGFNPETLRIEAQTAYLSAQVMEAGKYSYEPSKVEPGLAKELRSKGIGGDLSQAALAKALSDEEKLLQLRLTEGDVVGSTVAMVQDNITKIKAAMKSAGLESYSDKNAASLLEYTKRAGGIASAFGGLQGASNKYTSSRSFADSTYQQKLALLAKEISTKRIELAQQYNADTLKIDAQYYAQRSELARNYGVEAERAEEDHQRNIARMTKDHDKRMSKLAESRDALGIEDEMSAYQDQRQQADEDYQIQARRRSEDYANQLRELDKAHREQEAERRNAYNQELADLQVYAQNRRNQEAVEYGKLLRDIVQAFVDARNAFAQQIGAGNTTNTNQTANVTQNFNGVDGGLSGQLIKQQTYSILVDVFAKAKQ
jgi:hypothetical protein